jgi:hypothetical protein
METAFSSVLVFLLPSIRLYLVYSTTSIWFPGRQPQAVCMFPHIDLATLLFQVHRAYGNEDSGRQTTCAQLL